MLFFLFLLFLLSFTNNIIGVSAQQIDDETIADSLGGVFDLAIGALQSFLNFFLDFGDPNSVVSQLWNLLPIVGNNALPQSVILYICFAGGILYLSIKVKG